MDELLAKIITWINFERADWYSIGYMKKTALDMGLPSNYGQLAANILLDKGLLKPAYFSQSTIFEATAMCQLLREFTVTEIVELLK